MTEIHNIKCDLCGKTTEMIEGVIDCIRPHSWEHAFGKDFCGSCSKICRKFIESRKLMMFKEK